MNDSTTFAFPEPFGPVPSRRLGRSLGVNNIPPKICSYSCVYCQVGTTRRFGTDRVEMYPPADVVAGVEAKMGRLRELGEHVDYITFVADGEPTLDANLGRVIRDLKPLGVAIAVITNASLIAREDVRADLAGADWVSLKSDAVDEGIWRRINRPHASLDLDAIMAGMREFARDYRGRLVTETMLVRGMNDAEDHLRNVASFLAELAPERSYLAIPTRPPASKSVLPPEGAVVNRAYQVFSEHLDEVEYLIGYGGNAFASTGDAARDLLSITAVHPMKKEAVAELLDRTGSDWTVVRDLVREGALVEADFEGETFYMRNPKSFGEALNGGSER